jgi:hypothetical protein
MKEVKIKKIKLTAGDQTGYVYEVIENGKSVKFPDVSKLLKYVFCRHGSLYEYLGIHEAEATALGWDPSGNDFYPWGFGFKKFMEARGQITRVVEQEVSLRDFLLLWLNNQG